MAEKQVQLMTIKGGVVPELFGMELEKVIGDILNPAKDQTAKRTITIKLEFTPGDGDLGKLAIKCESKLAPYLPVETAVGFTRQGGKPAAYEFTMIDETGQGQIFDNVTVLRKEEVQ